MLSRLRACPMLVLLVLIVAAILLAPARFITTYSPSSPSSERFSRLAASLEHRLELIGIPQPERGTLAAMTFGYREHLDTHIRRQFQASGAAHMLAVSGLHTGILYLIITRLLTLFGRRKPFYEEYTKRRALSITIIILMWCYALLTGFTPSVTRAVLMLTLVETAKIFHREPLSINILCAAAALILLVRPNDLYSISFQLSFAAVAGILLMQPGLSRLLPVTYKSPRLLREAWSIVTVSVAAQVATLPLCLYYFGQTSNYFLLTNLLILWWIGAVIVAGLACLLLGGIPLLGTGLVFLTTWLVRLLHYLTAAIEGLPGSVTQLSISTPMVFTLYAAIMATILAFRHSLWWLAATASAAVLFCYQLTLL